MNLLELIAFLGHTTAYEPLDKFLQDHGVKKRPSLQHGGFALFPKKTGLAITFTTSAERDGIARKGEGTFVFYRVQCSLLEDEGHGLYAGPLPFNLKLKMDRDGVRVALGSPRTTLENGCDKFCLNGLVISCVYTKETQQLIRVTFYLPDNDDRQQGLCP